MKKLAAFLLLMIAGFLSFWGYESFFSIKKEIEKKDSIIIHVKDTLKVDTTIKQIISKKNEK